MNRCPRCGSYHIDSCVRFDDVGCRFYFLSCNRCNYYTISWQMLFDRFDRMDLERLKVLTQELETIRYSEMLNEILCRLNVIEDRLDGLER